MFHRLDHFLTRSWQVQGSIPCRHLFPLINPVLSSNPLFVYMAVDELSVEFVEAPEEFVPLVIIVMSLE